MNSLQRDIYRIDANGKVLGRLATDIAMHLMGKHRPDFQSHIDSGDIVEVTNINTIVVTGKIAQKEYYHHSQYPGGLKIKRMEVLLKENPAKVLEYAVSRMLPKNKHRENRLMRLKIS